MTSTKPSSGTFQHFAGADVAQIEAHERRDGHGHGDGEGSPGTALERVDHDQADDGEHDDHDEENGDEGNEAADLADFFARHLAERFAVAAHGAEQNDEILHGPGEDGAEDDPQGSGEIAELGGEGWADERAGSGDGGEMMAEENPLVGGFEIVTVAQAFGGSGAAIIEHHHFGGDEFGVEAEADRVDAGGGATSQRLFTDSP